MTDHIGTLEWLNDEMRRATADARTSGWSEEGQIVFVRNRINAAYRICQRRIDEQHLGPDDGHGWQAEPEPFSEPKPPNGALP